MEQQGVYNNHRIAWELERTAKGDGFYGNAIRVAKDIPGLTPEDIALLDRYATGGHQGTDHVKLQDLALRVDRMESPPALSSSEKPSEALIAAAPELLQALKECQDYFEAYNDAGDKRATPYYNLVLKAIAKAES